MLAKSSRHLDWLQYSVGVTPNIIVKRVQIVKWLNDTVGEEGRDWTLDEVYRSNEVRFRTQHQAEMFINRWKRYCLN